MVFVFVLGLFVLLLSLADGIDVSIDLNSSQKKCFGEELSKHTLLVTEFNTKGEAEIGVSVADPSATIFTDKEKTDIKTAFTTNQPGTHMFCVQNLSKKGVTVWLSIKWGAHARDYSQIAKKEHLDPMMTSLRKAADDLKLYHSNILYMREREERMRQTNDSTADRVMIFTALSVFIMLAVASLQAYYFRTFFRSKKII
uniref:GOLD domain-containing protein n=1 Tax=Chromera velia CCMP2878 TaxID=1169474 RepID=A0A0G4GIQ5_9ALVE|mmetsp:Transcript_35942/g.70737  ORF Transcript_35942/g.70737 Transcript_35942/m.70737 type:complete len:199 (+) Transcript_35942:357-953(+)|eukprot:Cvel_22061.t1-p1 / transcript=Cvel_22061.t1 / gene=Cvel_22061 / organism=Chromera_velia_CCMP2878 / gene_product=Transmembrane emp24 domain-containing protein 10, putative / transcript_product=Transmembrane emp24 domain-containing protein 10, putative / location=Cvel_scaffold2131:852-3007(-) / protein_length=198 / sequence_SO=supercontig / SO=protein_coding / is_pseudo=false